MADLTTILADLVQQHDAAQTEAAKKRAVFLGGCKSFGQYLLNMESDPSKALTLVSPSAFADNAAKLDRVLQEWKAAANSADQFAAAVTAIRNLLPAEAQPAAVVQPSTPNTVGLLIEPDPPKMVAEVELEQEPEPVTPDPGLKTIETPNGEDPDGPMDIEALLDSAPQVSEVMARKQAVEAESKMAATTPAPATSDDFEDLLK